MGCPSSLRLLDPGAWADALHGFPTPSPAPTRSLQLPPRGLSQCAETLRPGERPVRLPASRDRPGLRPLQPRLLRPPAREGLPEVGGVRLWVHWPWGPPAVEGSTRGLRRGAWLGMCVPGPLPGTRCPTLKGDTGTVPWGPDSRPCQPRRQAKSSPQGCPVGRGPAWRRIPFSVTLSLGDSLATAAP